VIDFQKWTPKVTLSFKLFQLAACYSIVNWASDMNNYIAAVMVAIIVKVVRGAAIKLPDARMAI
jgi:hypothetical protein